MISVEELLKECDFSGFHVSAPEKELCGVYMGDLLSWVMGRAGEGQAWITIMSNQNVAAVAVLTELSCVILAEGVQPDAELLAAARQRGVNLLGSSLPAYETAGRLRALLGE